MKKIDILYSASPQTCPATGFGLTYLHERPGVINLEKHKIKDVAIAIKADGDVPVDPFQLTMLSSSKAYNLQFPYVAKYNKDNLDFIDGKEGLLLINPLGKMEDSKKQLEILDKKVSPSSILLLHDLMYGESCPFYHCDLTPCAGSSPLAGRFILWVTSSAT